MARDVVDLPVMGRAAFVRAESIDETARTVEIVWTTGAIARRWSWEDGQVDEELIVTPEAVRLDRLNNGAPFLNSHNAYQLEAVLGVIVDGSVRIEGGNGYATVRFADDPMVEPIWRKIATGIIRNVSVGYTVHSYQIEKREGQRTLYRAIDWEPMEVSAVAIGADPAAQFRSENAADIQSTPCALVRAVPAASAVNPIMESTMTTNTNQPGGGIVDAARGVTLTTTPAPVPVVQATTPDDIRAAEILRSTEILGLCQRHGLAALATNLILTGATVDAARAAVLDSLAANDAAGGARSQPVLRGGMDETVTRAQAMQESIVAQLTNQPPSDLVRSMDLVGASLVELARERLSERRMPNSFGGREELLHRAFHSTSDFPQLFENALNRSLAARYALANPTYRAIARQRSYMDFRDHTTVRPGDFPTLKPVGQEAGEVKGGTFGESAEKTRVLPYGVRVNLSRQMLVNDSLGAIQQVLNDRGAAVARFEEATFYAMMLVAAGAGPTLLETTRPVFNTTDGSLAAVAAAITVASVGIGRAALGKRTSKDGAMLNLQSSILLVGPDKLTEAEQLVAPIQAQQAGNVNPFSGRLTVASTGYIPGNAWYVFANPAEAACFEWGLLDGYEAPRFRMEDVFGTQGTALTLEHDFGCGAIDFRGGYRNAGA